MPEQLADFHFLRPFWFLLLLTVPVLIWTRAKLQSTASNWKKVIDARLFEVLVPDYTSPKQSLIWTLLLTLGIALTTIALAGPAWQRVEQPVLKTNEALVVVLDLSPSMTAQDLTPSRVERAKLKIQEILSNRQDGFTSIVVYAGDAHVVAPLTDDVSTLENLLRSLHPAMMPLPGSDTAAGIELAQDLLEQSDRTLGQIILITDGVDNLSSVLNVHKQSYPVSIIGAGTLGGAPVPRLGYAQDKDRPDPIYGSDGKKRLLTDSSGNVVIARLASQTLRELAIQLKGTYSDLTPDNSDLQRVIQDLQTDELVVQEEKGFDAWRDMGAWFAIPVALLLLPVLRRGVLVLVLVVVVVDARADWLDDLFQTPDQQGHQALIEGSADRAIELFEDPNWLGVAQYRNGDFDQATQTFALQDGLNNRFNLGNALAKSGQLEEALATYEKILEEHPEHADAEFNRDLIKRILEQQQQQTDQQPQQSDGEESDENDPQQSQQESADSEEQSNDEPNDAQESPTEQNAEASETEDQEVAETQQEREDADTYERWLRRIPDDPGGLLRTKFRKTTQSRIRNGEIRRPSDNQVSW